MKGVCWASNKELRYFAIFCRFLTKILRNEKNILKFYDKMIFSFKKYVYLCKVGI